MFSSVPAGHKSAASAKQQVPSLCALWALVTPAKRGKGNKREKNCKTGDCESANRHAATTCTRGHKGTNRLKALVEIRVSQINGCAYCVNLHSIEARQHGEVLQRLDCLPVWRESGLFVEAEMEALAWAECVTHISTATSIDNQLHFLLQHYSEAEIVDLKLLIALMNCLNRLAISFGD